MQPLDSNFRSDGCDFTLIKRTGDVALFSKHKRGHKLTHYEVVIVQHMPAQTLPGGYNYPEREVMPTAEQWGTFGWTPFDLTAAHKRFDATVRSLGKP